MPENITERVRAIAIAAPIRSPERRAAAALHTALITTKTPEGALRCLRTFTTPETRAAALALFRQIELEDAFKTLEKYGIHVEDQLERGAA